MVEVFKKVWYMVDGHKVEKIMFQTHLDFFGFNLFLEYKLTSVWNK